MLLFKTCKPSAKKLLLVKLQERPLWSSKRNKRKLKRYLLRRRQRSRKRRPLLSKLNKRKIKRGNMLLISLRRKF